MNDDGDTTPPEDASLRSSEGPSVDADAMQTALDHLSEDVSSLSWRLAEGEQAVAERLDALENAPAQSAAAGSGAHKTRAKPLPWAATASVEDWRDVVSWVDWLTITYDLMPSRAVLPCWPLHGAVVHELAALRSAWLHAAATAEPSDSLAYWHDRLLAPCLARLHSDYQMRNCTERHHEVRAGRTTDRDVLDAVLLDVESTAADEDLEGVDPGTGEIA